MRYAHQLAAAVACAATGYAGSAQGQERRDDAPCRTRVILGPQLVPTYPGADRHSLRPYVDVSRADAGDKFAFESPDESIGFTVLDRGRLQIGPSLGFEGRRRRRDVGGVLPSVGTTVEVGGFAQYALTPSVRVRLEGRQGLGGHKGLIGIMAADYVARDRDRWVFSIGPRLTVASDRYNRAYFGVSSADAPAAGLPAFKANGGIQAVGATTGLLRQLTPRWGVFGYAKYDRLVDDPARSPIVRTLGSRNQVSGGLALSYTFGAGVN